ncbi:MAG: hypothetical protein P1P76_04600 [Anaerolineales bacterium]|nr:hypothetical protein [Anaerolineales bacterium]
MQALKKLLFPAAAGLIAMIALSGIYFGIVSLAESPEHALELFWEDRWIVIPIIIGFGIQVGLYVVLKKRLFIPVSDLGPSGALTGAGGGVSATAMVACCAHHVTDVLPLIGLTAAATFLAEYRLAFMLIGLGTTVLGILVMLTVLFRERRRAIQLMASGMETV